MRAQPARPQPRRSIGPRCVLAGSTALFCLALLELGLRLLVPPAADMPRWGDFRTAVTNRTAPRGSYRFVPDRGWLMTPGISFELDGCRHDIDAQGYRVNDNALQLGSDAAVLAVGDSFTFGHRLDNRETWPSALERKRRVRVVNAGVSGYGLDQMFVHAQRSLDLFPGAKTVLVALISDDLERLRHAVRAGIAKPHFEVDARGELRLVPADHGTAGSGEPGGPGKRILGHSYALHLILSNVFPEWWLRGTWHDYRDAGIDVVQVGRRIVDAFAQEVVARRGRALVFLLLPGSPTDLGMVDPAQNPAAYSIASHMAEIARRTPGVFVADLQSELARRFPGKAQRRALFHERAVDPAGHYDAEGADWVATVVAALLDGDGSVAADAVDRDRFRDAAP